VKDQTNRSIHGGGRSEAINEEIAHLRASGYEWNEIAVPTAPTQSRAIEESFIRNGHPIFWWVGQILRAQVAEGCLAYAIDAKIPEDGSVTSGRRRQVKDGLRH
jgi:hypothetical protein